MVKKGVKMDVPSIKDIYKYMDGKEFIITHEGNFKNKNYEPCGRPVVCRIEDIELDRGVRGTFKGVQFDYDEMVECAYEYDLPSVADIEDSRKGALVFSLKDEGRGRCLVTRFWEV